jgi:hypothetical protein
VGRVQGEALWRCGFEHFPRPQHRQRHDQVARGHGIDADGRPLSWYQRPTRHLPWHHAPRPWFIIPHMLLNCSRPILVRRPISEHGSAGAPETMRSPTATTTRRRAFGGAWRPSSQVRHRSCVDRLPSHASDLVLCARVAGPFSRLPSSQPMIKGAQVAYGSSSLRRCDARGCARSS